MEKKNNLKMKKFKIRILEQKKIWKTEKIPTSTLDASSNTSFCSLVVTLLLKARLGSQNGCNDSDLTKFTNSVAQCFDNK